MDDHRWCRDRSTPRYRCLTCGAACTDYDLATGKQFPPCRMGGHALDESAGYPDPPEGSYAPREPWMTDAEYERHIRRMTNPNQ